MTLKEMKEMARKSYLEKNGSNTTDYIETVGNKGVEHIKPSELPKPKKEDRE